MPEDNSIVILSPGREALEDQIHKNALPFLKLLDANGWTRKVGFNRFETYGEAYKSGPNVGERHGDQIVDNTYVEAVKEGRSKLMARWYNGAFDIASIGKYDILNLEQVRAIVVGEFDRKPTTEEWTVFKAGKKAQSDLLKKLKEERKNGIKV